MGREYCHELLGGPRDVPRVLRARGEVEVSFVVLFRLGMLGLRLGLVVSRVRRRWVSVWFAFTAFCLFQPGQDGLRQGCRGAGERVWARCCLADASASRNGGSVAK